MKIEIDTDIVPGSYDIYDGGDRVGEAYAEATTSGVAVHIAMAVTDRSADSAAVRLRSQPGDGRPSRTAFLDAAEWRQDTPYKVTLAAPGTLR